MMRLLILTLRNARKAPFFAVLNLSGLAIGLAVCWLVVLFVRNELRYDRFLDHAPRICQVGLNGKFGDQAFATSNTPPTVGPALQEEFGEVAAFTRIFMPGDLVVTIPGQAADAMVAESGGRAVDSNFLSVFDFELLQGSATSCLRSPGSVVLTERFARKYFGRTEATGETLLVDDRPRTVTAVLRDLPAHSSLQFDFLLPIADYPVVQRFSWSWVWLQVDTYVLLREGAETAESRAALEAKFPAMVARRAADGFRRIGQPYDAFIRSGGYWNFSLRPLTEVHLHSAGIISRLSTLGDVREVYLFSAVGLFVLVLACINFMNLSTARSARRLREVGVRKVLGSARTALVRQFLAESLLYALAAAVLAAGLIASALPVVNRLAGDALAFDALFSGWSGLLCALLPVVAGLLGGSYPAFYLSAFRPAALLKGSMPEVRPRHALLRGGLVVFQFTVAITLLVCTVVMFRQLHFARRSDPGFARDNVLIIRNTHRLGERVEALRQQLLSQPGVVAAGASTDMPTGGFFGDLYVPAAERPDRPVIRDISLNSYLVDEDFGPALGLRIVAGRGFSSDFPSDSAAVVLNETAVRVIGWENPVGQFLTYPGNGNQRFQVIGVMQDFHTESFHVAVEPFALFHKSSKTYSLDQGLLAVRLQPGATQDVLERAARHWKDLAPATPFDYAFLDQEFEALYRSEQKIGTALSALAGLAVLIACLGLLGLIAFAAERRTKEIAIRKVLGATAGGITVLLARDFMRLVGLALLLATPIAWYFMQRWLADFAYRIELEWWMFAAAGALAAVIVAVMAAIQGLKAAVVNPVKSLRSE